MKYRFFLLTNIILACSLIVGCGQSQAYDSSIFAMDTFMTLTAYGPNARDAVDAATEEIYQLESLLSATDSNSEIYQLNQCGTATLSDTVASVIERSLEINESTDSAYNMAIYPVIKLWGFPDKNYQLPDADALSKALAVSDIDLISYDSTSHNISFQSPECSVDLGGIAKGYTSDTIMDIYRSHGVKSGLVVLGGNVQVLGSKPDGSPFNIAIADPTDSEHYIGAVKVTDKAVITSGGYQRYFELDGKTYHHIIDPATGYPANNGLISVTIVSNDGTLADGLSTALYVMGLEKASEYYSSHSDSFDMILMDAEGNVYISQGLSNCFTSDVDYMIINP